MRSTSSDERDYEKYFGSEDAERRLMDKELRDEADIDAYIEEFGSGPRGDFGDEPEYSDE